MLKMKTFSFVRLACAMVFAGLSMLGNTTVLAQGYPVVVPASSSGAASRAIVQINQADIYNNIANAYNTANYAIGVGSNAQNTANYAVNVGSAAQGAADYANARVNELASSGTRGSWATMPGQPVGLSNGCNTDNVYCNSYNTAWGTPIPTYSLSGGCIWGFPQTPGSLESMVTIWSRKYPNHGTGTVGVPTTPPPSINCPAGSGYVALSQGSEGPVPYEGGTGGG